ncbi:hypothetical protein [Polyangium aurulentum]|uniref:hypothetical protein n=1 Tax=Polyangium aurulentum TaxID=2567896 RepID=UPI0010AE951D|nr:hypothetical protein [Polyangium aurulentum]UQA58580.1 hypothetical protein E8A73_046320 [Polyangium aurulentum]
MDEISIREEILRAASVQGVALEELQEPNAEDVRERLLQRFGKDLRYELNCNNLADYVAVQHPDSWIWVEEYLSTEPVLFFYDDERERSVFRFRSGQDLVRVIKECYGFVYYVTNETLDYVVCHNDHDYILGAGKAKAWVESLMPRHEEWVRSLKTNK